MSHKIQPVNAVEWVSRETLFANDYNPNHVAPPEMDLLARSILEDGWTQPIVARENGEIIDGFHRWTVSGRDDVGALTGGLVPVVRIDKSPAEQRLSTIRHNRARGTHGVRPMASIVSALLASGMPPEELVARLGMELEEVERLADHAGMPTRASRNSGGFNAGWKPSRAALTKRTLPE